jgi:hypothetical protein
VLAPEHLIRCGLPGLFCQEHAVLVSMQCLLLIASMQCAGPAAQLLWIAPCACNLLVFLQGVVTCSTVLLAARMGPNHQFATTAE